MVVSKTDKRERIYVREIRSSSKELQSILEDIKSSDVVESRVQLITKLGGLDLSGESDLASLAECLTTFWEDFTCLDVSQCILNKTILQVAAKCLESVISGCLGKFLILGTKASIWCGKHLKMTLMSTEDSQEEEHSSTFYQLLLDLLRFSATSFSSLARYPISGDKALMGIVDRFTLEQLNLAKDSISEIKRLPSFGSEVLKVAQAVLDAAIRICRVYSESVNWDLYSARTEKDKSRIDSAEADDVNHVINLAGCTIEKLCELGILAANDGGNLVAILNVSWKGVVTLLQLGKGALVVKVNVSDIIRNLISLANESLRGAAEVWSSSLEVPVSVAEARRTFLPVKFYLINAARISSQYPCEAFLVYKEITLCLLMISTLRVLLSKDSLLNNASEVLVDLLEPTSFHLLNSLLNSAQLKQELKFQVLDWLFTDESVSHSYHGDTISDDKTTSMGSIFSITCEAMPNARILLLGKVVLFLDFLKSSDFEEDVRLGITRKLGWLLNTLVDEEVYSSILALQIPILYGSGKTTQLAWQPLFFTLLFALKTFMILVSSSLAWVEMESFLLNNFFHPHFLCWEILMELWCFMVRHAEIDMVNDIMDKLCSLLKLIASSEPILKPGSPLRKMARSISMLVTHGTQSMADRVYSSIVGDGRSQLSSIMYVSLLMEGFPLNLLSDGFKSSATQRIINDYFGFIESFDEKSLRACRSGVFGAPVFALSAALQSLEVGISDINNKTLKFLVAIINHYRKSVDTPTKNHYCKLLCETLGVVSNMKNLYASNEMDGVILELQNLFISREGSSDTQLYQCKPDLARFMASLGHMEISESEGSAKSCAIWELYNMLLRERHWAFVHLAITAFGFFAGRTCCSQLWRFVPQDAALSFDVESGKEANEERFMSELKAVLDKERDLPGDEQVGLVKEGLMLRGMVEKVLSNDLEAMECEMMEVDGENHASKKRKLPDGISKGIELIQNGLKVMGSGLSEWQQNDSIELHDKLLTHFSCLEEMVSHLVGFAGSV